MKTLTLITALLLLIVHAAGAGVSDLRLDKPPNDFVWYQLNLAWDWDSTDDGWDLADHGARTQLALELLHKDESTLQRGYVHLIEPLDWNVKVAVEAVPDGDRLEYRFRPLETWIRFATRWDRTTLTVGHRGIPYGHNPRLDPGMSFLPNMASGDLGFSRDTGAWLKTPIAEEADLELSLTGAMGDSLEYHGGWLVTSRIGTPTFRSRELGFFAMVGEAPEISGTDVTDEALTGVLRLGLDGVIKRGERWKAVAQASVGRDRLEGVEASVANLLGSWEWYAHPRLTLGVTATARHLRDREGDADGNGRLSGSVSFAIARDVRLRLNAWGDVWRHGAAAENGVGVQLCYNCGLLR